VNKPNTIPSADSLGLNTAGIPPTVAAAFAPVSSLAQAEAYTRDLTHTHYENFSVISIFVPKHLRQDFCNVYAFCRTADDLGDEVGDRALATQYLADFRAQTHALYAGQTTTAVFTALAGTVKRHDIPIQPFLDLISAFEQDQHTLRYETFDQVVDYCRRSADPVGRLVLYMSGYRDEHRQQLSDKTCTALQLANFWQDVRRDILERDRIYIPQEDLRRFAVTEDDIRHGRITQNFRDLMRFQVDRTQQLFNDGLALLPLLNHQIRPQISLFNRGGQAVLTAIRNQNYDTLTKRPRLSKMLKARLMLRALVTITFSKLHIGGSGGVKK